MKRVSDVPTVRIKICGVTTVPDALAAIELGADAVGLNFYPNSPRFVTPDQAKEIVMALPPFATTIGVFVETHDQAVASIASRVGLRAVQTYSDAPPNGSFFPVSYIPAFPVKDAESLAMIREFVASGKPSAVLLDAHVPGQIGGTGQVAPWDLLAGFDPGVPVILAGGLNSENVGVAIRTVRPWAVDVASGVESAPGQKDRGKMAAFIRAVRAAAANLPEAPPNPG